MMSTSEGHSLPLPQQFLLTDKVAIVTGAGKGIGAGIAVGLAEAGADVAIVARTRTDLDHVADQIRRRGRRALVLPADMNKLGMLPDLVESVAATLGGLDIVVNNAGGSQSFPFLATTIENLEASFHFNVSATFELSRLAVPHLLRRGGGSIVNISSVAGSRTTRGGLTHGTIKAAISHLTRMMAMDLAPRVRVNAVLPGAIETDALQRYLDGQSDDVRSVMVERTPMRRNGVPMDVAAAVLYLASPAASWVTGKLLEVDGNASADLIPKSLPDL
jgi:7-alpha-hydroxysteroid dehydrogenase